MTLPKEYVKAFYRTTGNPSYDGNPFIEALTPIMEIKQLKEGLEGKVNFSLDNLRAKPRKRAHMVASLLDDFFQPLSQHVLLEEKISIMIRRGYVSRNITDGSLNERLQEGYERIMAGDSEGQRFSNVLTTATCLSLIGCSGSGKSSTLGRILATYPQVIYHEKHNFYQLSYLKIECPNNGSQKSLCLNFFREVDRCLGTTYLKQYRTATLGEDNLLNLMGQVANERAIGVLVIDEIQRLRVKKFVGREQMLEFFVELVNTVGIPVVLVGTPKARPLFEIELQSARRTTGIGSLEWTPMRQYPKAPRARNEWVAFTNKLWCYQWLNKRDEVLSDEIRDCWYELSQGVLDIVVKLFVLAQLRSIATKLERITVDVMRSVYEDELKPVHAMLDALRRQDSTAINKYSDLHLSDFDKKALTLYQKISELPDEPALPFSNNEQAMRLYNMLVQMDCRSELLAPLVERIFEEQPKLTLREMMPVILEWYEESKVQESKEPKTVKPELVKHKDWVGLESDDLRFIHSQLNKTKSFYSALKERGQILDLRAAN
ncbi:AAA family ATPase [Vibrio atlanticus]|uniref:AAA family ATPase n=1 Tax=Vibrio atlanticus TaxID=693153 RepID=UPI0022AFED7F|nr:AAA family ATPase [Vibrio atlanticus]MCZ4311290.1 AAA family ATPase [Vibrio atlanticus]